MIFKQINDTYGHMFGDEVLQTFSEILLKHMKGQGLVTRFGGEKFMAGVPHDRPE